MTHESHVIVADGRPVEFVSIREAADFFATGTAVIRRLVRAGELPSRRIGKHIRIPATALAAYAASAHSPERTP